jgi:hypothetical protein
MPGTSANAWAAPIPKGDRECDVLDRPGPRTEAIGDQHDHAADDQREGHEADRAERRLDDVLEEQSGDRRRDGRGDQQPCEATVRVGRQRAVTDRGEPGRDEPEPVIPEVDEQRDKGPEVEHHAERQRGEELVVPAGGERDDDQVPR